MVSKFTILLKMGTSWDRGFQSHMSYRPLFLRPWLLTRICDFNFLPLNKVCWSVLYIHIWKQVVFINQFDAIACYCLSVTILLRHVYLLTQAVSSLDFSLLLAHTVQVVTPLVASHSEHSPITPAHTERYASSLIFEVHILYNIFL